MSEEHWDGPHGPEFEDGPEFEGWEERSGIDKMVDETMDGLLEATIGEPKPNWHPMGLDVCPPAYGGCRCECHHNPGVVHVAACCHMGMIDTMADDDEVVIPHESEVEEESPAAIEREQAPASGAAGDEPRLDPFRADNIDYEVTVCDGKYTYQRSKDGHQRALRYGEEWRGMTGDGFVLAMAQRIEELTSMLNQLGYYYDE